MSKVQFPKYESGKLCGATQVDASVKGLPKSIRLDVTRWTQSFSNRCKEQLKEVTTNHGKFIEARLEATGDYPGATPFGHNIVYHQDEETGIVTLQEHLLAANTFTLSGVSKEATAKITPVDIQNPKSATEDALILHLLRNGVTTDEFQSLHLRMPQWFTNQTPAPWHAMLERDGNLEVTSFYENFYTRIKDFVSISRKRLHGVESEIIRVSS